MREVNCYGYVPRGYDEVRALLLRDPIALLRRATSAGATRARKLYTELRVGGGVTVQVDVEVELVGTTDGCPVDGGPALACTGLELNWKAASHTSLFPLMRAKLSAWPVVATETQLSLEGHYQPPLGVLGTALDAMVGHRIAEATLQRFLEDVIDHLGRASAPQIDSHRQETAIDHRGR
jgi:hypothetical protein